MSSNSKILILDDDEDLLEMVTFILSKKQFNVTPIKHWEKIYESIKNFSPDIILMDIYLGTMDGRQLCRKLKEDPDFHAIPIILYSAGNITQDSIKESLSSDFIIKPFDIDFLIAKITLYLGNEPLLK
ncbi:MAG: response regulator [Ferruginibacter sp.]